MNLSDADLENLLKRHFGRAEFEPDQKDIIATVLSGRNVLAVTHRGFDQSICYKLPALVLDGLTLVVSRTGRIVEKEDSALLPAAHISSSVPAEHLQKRLWNMARGEYKLVYAGPEQFRNRAFLFALIKIPVSLLSVEDAHRISRWGHDFRSDYLDISKAMVGMDSQPRILALAGPCTQRTRDDILYQLQIYDAKRITLDLARPNLSLEVRSAFSPDEKYDILGSLVRELSGQGIVYTNSRRQTAEVRDFLKELEPKVAVYHAGLGREKRIEVERDFEADQLRVVVTTGSFGVRMDKSSIRYVIHLDIPDSPERYYEQISMAGGDGQPARCVLIYSPSDRRFHHSMIERNAVSSAEIWRINDVLERHRARGAGEQGSVGAGTRPLAFSLPLSSAPNAELNHWLREHSEHLPVEAQNELTRLRQDHEDLGAEDRNPLSPGAYEKYLESERWKQLSQRMLAEQGQCYVCGRKSEHVHHRHYRTLGKERADDVTVLCAKCHCFIHPDSPMTRKIFEEICESEEKQLKLFQPLKPGSPLWELPSDPPLSRRPSSDPPLSQRGVRGDLTVAFPYGQLELEVAIDRYKLHTVLREMEIAGILSVLPDCSMQARARILVHRDKLTAYAEDETGQSVAEWLLQNSESDPRGEIYIDFARLKAELSHPHDVLEDCLLALYYAEAIFYRPIRRGIALRLMDLDAPLTDDVFEKLKASRYQALRAVEEYVNTSECRQKFLCHYLGDETEDNCGNCDNCVTAPAGAEVLDMEARNVRLPHYARVALELVNKSEGRLYKDALVGILAGTDQRTTRFDKWDEFGALSMFAPKDILRMLDLLIGHGFLKEEGGSYASIDLTGKGFRVLEGEFSLEDARSIVSLAEDMKRVAQTPPSPIEQEASSEQDRILITILRCAEKTYGQVGRSGLAKILRGQESKKLAKYGFDHLEEYASLSDMPKKIVLEHIDAMIERGCLAVTSFFFPMLQLTELGQKRLEKYLTRTGQDSTIKT